MTETLADHSTDRAQSQLGDPQVVELSKGIVRERYLWKRTLENHKSVHDMFRGSSVEQGREAEFLDEINKLDFYKRAAPLAKAFAPEGMAASARRLALSVHPHPFDMRAAVRMRELSPHHGSCIDTTVAMVAGMGFEDESIYETLDPMTINGFQSVLEHMTRMLVTTGNAYIETARPANDDNGLISGLYSIFSPNMLAIQHGPAQRDMHFLHTPLAHGFLTGHHNFTYMAEERQTAFANFGRVSELTTQVLAPDGDPGRILSANADLASGTIISGARSFRDFGEVIHFSLPTEQFDTPYGAPRWQGALPYLELNRCHLDRTHALYINNGAPDSVLFLYGVMLSDEQQLKLREVLDSTSSDQRGKSVAIVFPNADAQTAKAHVEKFGAEVNGSDFVEINDAIALSIVSAHRLSPSLAGISTQRSLASANELTQALVVAQMLVSNPLQNYISKVLACTLGGEFGIPALRGNEFRLKAMTDVQDMAALNNFARQRQGDSTLTNGAAQSTDLRR